MSWEHGSDFLTTSWTIICTWIIFCLFWLVFVLGVLFFSSSSILAVPKWCSHCKPRLLHPLPIHPPTFKPLIMPKLRQHVLDWLTCPITHQYSPGAQASHWLFFLTFFWLHLSIKFATLCVWFFIHSWSLIFQSHVINCLSSIVYNQIIS